MSRMPSQIDQAKARAGFVPAGLRPRCGLCSHGNACNGAVAFSSFSCGKHGYLVTGFAICKDFSAAPGSVCASDPPGGGL